MWIGSVSGSRSKVPRRSICRAGNIEPCPSFPSCAPTSKKHSPRTVHVINGYRDAGQNLGTQLVRIIGRAGLKPWPKPFHNLRASRETELMEAFPAHVVCAWRGNSEAMAAKHYLTVTISTAAQNPARKLRKIRRSKPP